MRNHKRKTNIILLSMFICLSLTSCITANTRNNIIDALKNKNIITKDYELLDIVANSATAVPGIPSYDYIFVTSDADESDITNKNDANTYDKGVMVVRVHSKNEYEVYTVEIFYGADIYLAEKEYTDSNDNKQKSEYYDINYLNWDSVETHYIKHTSKALNNMIMTDKKGTSLFVNDIKDKIN